MKKTHHSIKSYLIFLFIPQWANIPVRPTASSVRQVTVYQNAGCVMVTMTARMTLMKTPNTVVGAETQYKVSHVWLFDFVPIYLAIDDQFILLLQRELSVMASSAPITPASPPPHTATAFRSVQTALTSTIVVSEPVCLEESKAFISWVQSQMNFTAARRVSEIKRISLAWVSGSKGLNQLIVSFP